MLHDRPEQRRLAVFIVVGTFNTALCYGFFAVLVHVLNWHYNLALVVDYGFGIALGYVLHRGSTFADRRHVPGAFMRYTAALVAAFFLNLAILDVAVRMQWLEPLAGQAVAMGAATMLSYALQKRWVFPQSVEQDEPVVLQLPVGSADTASRATRPSKAA